MKKLFFNVGEKIFYYHCNNYTIENDFYIFIDIKTQTEKRFHATMFRGEETI